MTGRTEDAWRALRRLTSARIALGRAGGSLPTAEWLAFSAAHAGARDAVHSALDAPATERDLAPLGLPVLRLHSAAPDRATYLQRPDLGRVLSEESRSVLSRAARGFDVVLALGDGLSALAAQRHGPALLAAIVGRLRAAGLSIGPLCLVEQARVAVEDEIGEALGARLAVIALGERPGLGAADGLGVYLVHGPRRGRADGERNCVSNVRPASLPVEPAAELVAWLCTEALRRGLTGVALKDERAPAMSAGAAARLDGA